MSNEIEQPCKNPIENQRAQALKHYEQASIAICHWSGFVENAIKAYNPEQPSPPTRLREVIEEMEKEVNIAEHQWPKVYAILQPHLHKLKSLTDLPLPASSLKDELTIEDYKEVIEDNNRLCRELDAIINGDTMAEQASLCDLVSQLRKMFEMK